MKKVLIIRSVSLQQLDKNLPHIYKAFPDSEFYLLTHSHNIKNCKKYKGIKEILDYKKRGNFSPFFINNELKKKDFENVIYVVSNIKGNGFLNVSLLALRLSSNSIFSCNLNSKIEKISKTNIILKLLKSIIITPLSILLTTPVIPIIFLTLVFIRIKPNKSNS